MAKRVQIQADTEDVFFAAGIASDEKIWKLCHALNLSLGLSLKPKEPGPEAETPEGLLPLAFSAPSEACYEDTQTRPRSQYMLCPIRRDGSPKEIRIFAYCFFLFFPPEESPDLPALLRQLQALPNVKSAADLTRIRNIQYILP